MCSREDWDCYDLKDESHNLGKVINDNPWMNRSEAIDIPGRNHSIQMCEEISSPSQLSVGAFPHKTEVPDDLVFTDDGNFSLDPLSEEGALEVNDATNSMTTNFSMSWNSAHLNTESGSTSYGSGEFKISPPEGLGSSHQQHTELLSRNDASGIIAPVYSLTPVIASVRYPSLLGSPHETVEQMDGITSSGNSLANEAIGLCNSTPSESSLVNEATGLCNSTPIGNSLVNEATGLCTPTSIGSSLVNQATGLCTSTSIGSSLVNQATGLCNATSPEEEMEIAFGDAFSVINSDWSEEPRKSVAHSSVSSRQKLSASKWAAEFFCTLLISGKHGSLVQWLNPEKLIFQVQENKVEKVAQMWSDSCPQRKFKATWGNLTARIRYSIEKDEGYFKKFHDTEDSAGQPKKRTFQFGSVVRSWIS